MLAQAIPMNYTSRYHLTKEQLNVEVLQIKAAQADLQRFEPLYKKYYPGIVTFIYQRVADKEVVYDITSQVFIQP